MPYVPSAIWVYLSWYPAMLCLFALDLPRFRRISLALLLGFLICAVGHAFWPVTIARPPLEDSMGLTRDAIAILYAIDPPRNIFPSFHAAAAFNVAGMPFRSRATRYVVTVWATSVAASCVLVGQHLLIDVLAGTAVAIAANGTTSRFFPGPSRSDRVGTSRQTTEC
jgi:membrane-associated phospholipid phosphatase